MQVMYCVSELLDWVDVATHFEKTKKWKPSLWLTTSVNHNYVKDKFPSIDTINFYNANRGVLNKLKKEDEIILSSKIIFKYLKYEKIALKMMDRMDPSGYTFNYSERTQLYYNILEYILNYIHSNEIDIVIFNESPHSIFTYLIYAVCVENNIKILRLSPTHINGNTFLTSTLESKQLYLEKIYVDVRERRYISAEVEDYFSKINGQYNNASPYYMSQIISSNNKSDIYKILKASVKFVKYYFKQKNRQSYTKDKSKSIRETFSNKELARTQIKRTIYKIDLQKSYQKYVKQSLSDFDLNEKFIYFPLQYQPEKSTSPEGDIFADQYLAINMLSKVSQGRFKIYIKEHISQFSIKLNGEQGRVSSFYEEISLLDNIVFVSTEINSFSLIDKAIAVSTITGTAGFESVIRGKPAIIFGYPWYKDCIGIFQISDVDELKNAVDLILNKYKINIDDVKCFLQSVFQISEKIYLNNSNKNSIDDKNHNNTNSIINLIENYEQQVL